MPITKRPTRVSGRAVSGDCGVPALSQRLSGKPRSP
jgi:hypothetical protein